MNSRSPKEPTRIIIVAIAIVIQMRVTKTAAYYISPIEIGVL